MNTSQENKIGATGAAMTGQAPMSVDAVLN